MSDIPITAMPPVSAPARKSRKGRLILGLILAVLLLLLGLATFLLFRLIDPPGGPAPEADLGGVTWVRSIYGMSLAPQDQFGRTAAAVPGPDGSIYIVDAQHLAVMRFTPDGRFIEFFRGPANDPLAAPSRMAVGSDGLMYIVETQQDRVRVLDPEGNDAGSFNIPRPISVAVSDDRIVVGSVMGFAILDKEGNPVEVIGSRGQADYQFDYVHGVAIAEDGNIFVADSFNNRLSAYDADGNRLWIVRTGKPGNQARMEGGRLTVREVEDQALRGRDALQLPLGITLDGAGRIVVADMFECTLAVFNSEDGSFVGKFGNVGAEDGKFFYPTSVSYDPQRDWFTVADSLNNRAQVVRIPGSSAGGDIAAAANRAITGPARACAIPLALIILVAAILIISRAGKKRKDTLVTP